MKPKINIAIDGHSSCGKSTLAKSLAKALNYVYVDSGAMYRAITFYAIKQGFVSEGQLDSAALIKALDTLYVTFKYNSETKNFDVYLNGDNVEGDIRTMPVSDSVSEVSSILEVREKLVRLQKRMAEFGGVVMDGRDIGTVVIPEAQLKIFMTADVLVRAERRYRELVKRGVEISLPEVQANLQKRDSIDSSREHDPLTQAPDAIILDNSHLSVDEQFEFAMTQVHKAIEKASEQAPT